MTFVLLVRTFRSLLLPLKAVLLNVLSVAATFGGVVLFWQQGYGSEVVFDIEGTGAVTFFVPILIFAFLFGLSMDYEVFILARAREEYDRTGSTPTAVVEGLARTGRLVTSAALILFLSFVALASAPNTDIKVMGTALGFGILLDATIVRALLVPALVSLLGPYNWWLPAWLARPLRVEPSRCAPTACRRAGSPAAGAMPGPDRWRRPAIRSEPARRPPPGSGRTRDDPVGPPPTGTTAEVRLPLVVRWPGRPRSGGARRAHLPLPPRARLPGGAGARRRWAGSAVGGPGDPGGHGVRGVPAGAARPVRAGAGVRAGRRPGRRGAGGLSGPAPRAVPADRSFWQADRSTARPSGPGRPSCAATSASSPS